MKKRIYKISKEMIAGWHFVETFPNGEMLLKDMDGVHDPKDKTLLSPTDVREYKQTNFPDLFEIDIE